MKTKPILRPERLRLVPRQFSWIDQRLVRDRHIRGRTTQALALYLFLCTVADAQGMSYYSDPTVLELLALTGEQLRHARAELAAAGLIAFRAPFYQVLSLAPVAAATMAPPPGQPRSGEARSAGDILRSILQKP